MASLGRMVVSEALKKRTTPPTIPPNSVSTPAPTQSSQVQSIFITNKTSYNISIHLR